MTGIVFVTTQIYASENAELKALRAKNWAEEKYMKLAPSTRRIIKGMIMAAKVASTAAGV